MTPGAGAAGRDAGRGHGPGTSAETVGRGPRMGGPGARMGGHGPGRRQGPSDAALARAGPARA